MVMKRSGLVRIVFFLLVISGSAIAANSAQTCVVTDIIRIAAPDTFICRVENSEITAPVFWRVRIQNIDIPDDDNSASKAEDFVTNALENACLIKLTNIKPRNYFRFDADIIIDGNDLAQQLVENNLAQAVTKTELSRDKQNSVAPQKPSAYNYTLRHQLSADTAALPQTNKTVPRVQFSDAFIKSQLKRLVDVSQIDSRTTFSQALEILQESITPQLKIVVLWKDLEQNAFIEKTTPVGLEGLTIVPLGKALELILASVGSNLGQVEYVVDGGIVTIATKQLGLSRKMTNRIYDMGELASEPSDFDSIRNYFGSQGSSRSSGSNRNSGSGTNRSRSNRPGQNRSGS